MNERENTARNVIGGFGDVLGGAFDHIGQMRASLKGRGEEYRAAKLAAVQELDTTRKEALFQDMVKAQSLLKRDPTGERAKKFLINRRGFIEKLGGTPTETNLLIDMLDKNNIEGVQKELIEGIATGQRLGYGPEKAKTSAATEFWKHSGLSRMSDNQGNVIWRNAQGQILSPEEVPLALADAHEAHLNFLDRQSQIDIKEAAKKEALALQAKRNSDLHSELSGRNREASRRKTRVKEALVLSEQAADGLQAGLARRLANIFPNIDVKDENALTVALTQLQLDYLQSFKGPTTDFEFGVTQRITGSDMTPKESRRAMLKALERSAWFMKEEYNQYMAHLKNGGSSDNFAFNLGAIVSTKKGDFSLEDIQKTAVSRHMSIEDVLRQLNKAND
jgi:hypothetical protein